MSSFTQALVIEYSGKGAEFVVDQPFIYNIGHEYSHIYSEVPAGFKTDLATIPWFMQWLIPKVGKYNQAAVLHDWHYRHAYYRCTYSPHTQPMTRKYADYIFSESMQVLGVKGWRRCLIYAAVRAFGGARWAECREKDMQDYPTDYTR